MYRANDPQGRHQHADTPGDHEHPALPFDQAHALTIPYGPAGRGQLPRQRRLTPGAFPLERGNPPTGGRQLHPRQPPGDPRLTHRTGLTRHTRLPGRAARLTGHARLPGSTTRLACHTGLSCGATRLTGHTGLPCGATGLTGHTGLPCGATRLSRGSGPAAARTGLSGRRARRDALLTGHPLLRSDGTRRVGQRLRRNPGRGVGSPLREHAPDPVVPSRGTGLLGPLLHGFDPRDPPLVHHTAVRIDLRHPEPVGNLRRRRSPDTAPSRRPLGIRLTGNSPRDTDPSEPPVRIRTGKGPRPGRRARTDGGRAWDRTRQLPGDGAGRVRRGRGLYGVGRTGTRVLDGQRGGPAHRGQPAVRGGAHPGHRREHHFLGPGGRGHRDVHGPLAADLPQPAHPRPGQPVASRTRRHRRLHGGLDTGRRQRPLGNGRAPGSRRLSRDQRLRGGRNAHGGQGPCGQPALRTPESRLCHLSARHTGLIAVETTISARAKAGGPCRYARHLAQRPHRVGRHRDLGLSAHPVQAHPEALHIAGPDPLSGAVGSVHPLEHQRNPRRRPRNRGNRRQNQGPGNDPATPHHSSSPAATNHME
ncbi:hypothetical protein C1J01_19505 [Nonomuraea aridisoli]|uniref:Uncharacterized protein n=1 Tax=Nonomuraea aridisoli TaxID=2070368 RepID=A0A2W2FPG7_9ACTN|nr:hypothetical protein C1J01_19505 [Nonomuraea aridisoli]